MFREEDGDGPKGPYTDIATRDAPGLTVALPFPARRYRRNFDLLRQCSVSVG